MARRITRKQLKQDEFVSTMDTAMQWVGDNWRPMLAALAAVCGVALIWWVAANWTGARDDRASYALHEAMVAATGDEGLAGAEQQLTDLVDEYGRSDQADVARLYLARLYLERGEDVAARDLLLRVSERQRTSVSGRLATMTLLELRIDSGQSAEVAQELEAMVTGSDPRLPRDVALFQLGRMALDQQQPEQARGYFQKLVDEFPESPYRPLASQRLAELG